MKKEIPNGETRWEDQKSSEEIPKKEKDNDNWELNKIKENKKQEGKEDTTEKITDKNMG